MNLPVSTINKLNIRVDVSPATPTTSDYSVCDHWYRVISIFKSTMGRDDETEGDFTLVEQR